MSDETVTTPTPATDIHALVPAEKPGPKPTIVELPANEGAVNVCGGVTWSYSAVPTNGGLLIHEEVDGLMLTVDIVAGGPGQLTFNPPLRCTRKNNRLFIVLANGGDGVIGKVHAHAWVEA